MIKKVIAVFTFRLNLKLQILNKKPTAYKLYLENP